MPHYIQKMIHGQRVTFHRYLMEQHIGRALLLNEIVHHKDGNKYNNKISNLEIRDKREHNIISGRTNRPTAKLTPKDIPLIRRMLQDGIKQAIIALAYGVNQKTISDINIKENWAWV